MTWTPLLLTNQRRSANAEHVRISVVLASGKKPRRPSIALQFPALVLQAVGWQKGDKIVVDVGRDEHHGALRLRRVQDDPDARSLQGGTNSSGLRVFLPVFPWLRETKTRPQDAMETRVASGAVIVCLPHWARPPVEYHPVAMRKTT